MKIISDDGWYMAVLDEVEAGITVAVWQKMVRGEESLWKPVGRETIDVPLHVARDRVFDLVNGLYRKVEAWPARA